MENIRAHLPNLDRLSILAGTILLAYALTQFISIPTQVVDFSVLGVYFQIQIEFSTLVALLVAGLAASGSAWLLHDHPRLGGSALQVVHWILPGLSALVLMLAVNQLPFGPLWWLAAAASGAGLMLVLTAEYITLDRDNLFYLPAELGITALSLTLFLILAISLHAIETRLFYRIPVLSAAALLVYLRIIYLRHNSFKTFALGGVPFLVIGELAAGLHYWPLGSIAFGIALTGPLYSLIEIQDLVLNSGAMDATRRYLLPVLILVSSWAAAILI